MLEVLIGMFTKKRTSQQGGSVGVYNARQVVAVQSSASAGIYNVRQLVAIADPDYDDVAYE